MKKNNKIYTVVVYTGAGQQLMQTRTRQTTHEAVINENKKLIRIKIN